MKKILFLIFIMAQLACSGCYNRLDINDAAIVQGYGWDLLEEDKVSVVSQAARPVPAEETGATAMPENLTFGGEGSSTVSSAREMYTFFPRTFLWIHSSTLLIQEDLARQGLDRIIDSLARNIVVRWQSYAYVVKNAPVREVLQGQPLAGCSARCINDLIKNQETVLGCYVPVQNIDIIEKLSTEGIELALPQIALDENNNIRLDSMAVFKGYNMIGELNPEESRGYRWLRPENRRGGLIILEDPAPGIKSVSLSVIRFVSKIRPEVQDNRVAMNIYVDCDLNFLGQSGTGEMITEEMRQTMENLAAGEIKKDILSCVLKSQSLGSDIPGYGLQLRRYQPGTWEELAGNWDQVFPSITTQVKAVTRIKREQLARKSLQLK